MGHFHSPAEIQTNSSRVMMNGFHGQRYLFPTRPWEKLCTRAKDLWHPQEERDYVDIQHLDGE